MRRRIFKNDHLILAVTAAVVGIVAVWMIRKREPSIQQLREKALCVLETTAATNNISRQFMIASEMEQLAVALFYEGPEDCRFTLTEEDGTMIVMITGGH